MQPDAAGAALTWARFTHFQRAASPAGSHGAAPVMANVGLLVPVCIALYRDKPKSSLSTRRLKVQVTPEDMQRLVSYPAPTYIIGIDERDEIGCIVSANAGSPVRFASLPTFFPLTCETLAGLWEEVQAFWDQHDMTLNASKFAVQ